ncbi:peptidyl-prolyl cis-trans isomerase, EpsD family [Janthinobacterium sp. BJB412]|nr:peptidyl-prolyl cis-trans isomerase, EpsD family [Janthinobacterium sp. BJB412]
MYTVGTEARKRLLAGALVLFAAGLSGCGGSGSKEPKSGQALASVGGEEITMLQLNEEMQRAGVQAGQQEAASKQLLESLIDRQLLLNEAVRDKLDRDPKVVQAVERAKALILAQSYMQKRIGAPAKPVKAEVEDYFAKHPEFFNERKQFDMRQLVFASKDSNDALKAAIDAAKSLDDAAGWMEQHKVKFARAQLSRTSADLPPELSAKLLKMPKGQLFIIKEGERSMLISIAEIKDSPVTLETAAPQIEQFLVNKKNKEAADAELARLRAAAKIEYLGGRTPPAKADAKADAKAVAAPAATPAEAAAAAPVAAPPAAGSEAQNARGVAGLK